MNFELRGANWTGMVKLRHGAPTISTAKLLIPIRNSQFVIQDGGMRTSRQWKARGKENV